MSQPDLFVVCKNCGSEVSPYVTECPYCGQRVRKRAPKIDRSGGEAEPKRRRRAKKLPRLRAEEIAGIAPDTRPYATGVLILVCVVAMLVYAAEPLRDLGYLFVSDRCRTTSPRRRRLALVRHPLPARRPARLRVRGARGGRPLRDAAGAPLRAGAGGPHLHPRGRRRRGARRVPRDAAAALGPASWRRVRRERRGARHAVRLARGRPAAPHRRGDDRENDLLGVYVIAAVLVLLSLTTEDGNIVGRGGRRAGRLGARAAAPALYALTRP